MNKNLTMSIVLLIGSIPFLMFIAIITITSVEHTINVYVVNNSIDMQDRDEFLSGKFENGISVESLNTVKVDGQEYLLVEFYQDTGIFEFSKDTKKDVSKLLDCMEVEYIIKE